jgi:hypothetical protein
MQNEGQLAAALFVMLFFLVLMAGWVALIVFGVQDARRKNRSPHWFWFGLHPLGALITFIVMKSLGPRKRCGRCLQTAPIYAQLCPYCQAPYSAPMAQGVAAVGTMPQPPPPQA